VLFTVNRRERRDRISERYRRGSRRERIRNKKCGE
jgi:hypothetical protein